MKRMKTVVKMRYSELKTNQERSTNEEVWSLPHFEIEATSTETKISNKRINLTKKLNIRPPNIRICL